MTITPVNTRDWTRMVIAVSGSSGLIGSTLTGALEARGHSIKRLVRRPANGAGENLAQRWNSSARVRIRSGRVNGTTALARAIAAMPVKPRVMLSGSAIGIYGSRGDAVLDESSDLGDDFLASVCREWEAATAPAADAGVRVVHLRTGLVMSRAGGALAKMLLP